MDNLDSSSAAAGRHSSSGSDSVPDNTVVDKDYLHTDYSYVVVVVAAVVVRIGRDRCPLGTLWGAYNYYYE